MILPGMYGKRRITGTGYDAAVMADTPFGYWKLDETTGTVVNDSSGSGKNGLRSGGSISIDQAPLITDGGRSYNIGGGGGYLDFGADFGSFTSFTFEGWFNFNAVNNQMHIATKWGATTADDLVFFLWLNASLQVQFIVNLIGAGGGAKTLNGTTVMTTGVRRHICVMFDRSVNKSRIYINGVLDAESATLGGSDPDVGSLKESLSVAAKVYNGVATDMTPASRFGNFKCDNLAFYKSALPGARVLAHYNAGIV